MSAERSGPRFHIDRPTDLRRSTPWHRLSYIVRELPDGLRALVPDLRAGPESRVLDFGCADQPYRSFFPSGVEYIPADLPGNPHAQVEIRPDGTLPLPDGSVDVVLSTQVLEHVRDPTLYLSECYRVLRPRGRMLLSTHGLMVWHPDPVDLWRWTGEGLRRQLDDAGFDVVRFEGIMGLAASAIQLLQDSIYFGLRHRRLQQLLALVLQSAIRLVERRERPDSKRDNALVFALVAAKP